MGLGLAPRRSRSGIAVLMMLVLGVASFTIVMHRFALASAAYINITSRLTPAPANPVKSYHKVVLPGTINAYPLSSFTITAILDNNASSAIEAPATSTAWRLSDSSIAVQVAGLRLYRPPRSGV